MARPAQFQRNLARLAERIERNAELAVRRAAVVADQVVTTSTPVDTGRARSNWVAALDAPSDETKQALDTSGATAIGLARAVIARYRIGSNRAIHITNNLPYVRALDEGSSAQAPQGMTRRAVQAAREVLRNARLLR